jgi:hypothetical protein
MIVGQPNRVTHILNMSVMNFSILILALVAGATILGFAFIRRDARRYSLALLSERTCPRCGVVYGAETANSAVLLKYRWRLAPTHSTADLNLSRENFLMTCPRCHEEFEFTMDAQLFVHPHVGILSFTKTATPMAPGLPEQNRAIIAAASASH